MDKYYLTTAIDYANAAPHIGHAYEKIAADIIARYKRLKGNDVFFLTGTDEHGSKVEKAALAAGLTPQSFVDGIAAKFQDAWKRLLISNDRFIRTTEEQHKHVVQEVFRKMREKGDVYKGKYVGLYCEGCEDFLRERDLKEDGTCPNHLKPPKQFEEENYFFALSKYKDAVRDWLKSSEGRLKPEGRRLEVLNQLEDPELADFSITRSRSALTWGIAVPDEPDQVIYVWIDALTNYLTGAGYLTDEKAWQKYWPADLHLIGKDISKFHAIYWPAMLMSIEVPLPNLVFGHGFITVEGQKMSKSLGNVLDPVYLTETYGADAVRYFLFAANTFDQDGDFSVGDMISLVNSHLANNLGNLLNRLLTLLDKNFAGKVPEIKLEQGMSEKIEKATASYMENMEIFEFSKAIKDALSLVDESNKYINDSKPWALFKEGKMDEGGKVIATSMCFLKRAAILLSPIMPKLANEIWMQLGFKGTIESVTTGSDAYSMTMPAGQAVNNMGPVFKRIEDVQETAASATK
ncbi:MAG: methionine--tRNA ligase [Candidatus Obscuribacterales bacterium]|nr:methionine--tRNA ligase [Candidatus Obscuribacterales bacterium]